MKSSIYRPRTPGATVCSLALLGGLALPSLAQAPTNLLVNPKFEDTDGDRQPDKWRCNGTADGATIKVAVTEPGTVQLLDADKAVGAGFAQYVPIQAGHKYQLSASIKNTGSLGIYIEYLDKIPTKESMIRQHLLGEDNKVSASDSADFKTFTVAALAPAGATQARIWFYVPKIGVTDALIKDPVFQDLGAVAGAPTEAAPAAAPKAPRAATPAAAGGAADGPAELVNPEMKDADGDGLPDGWRVFPSADGDVAKVVMDPTGGAHLVDTDKTKGIGIQQQLPAQAGVPYTFSATMKGSGSISLNLQFLRAKPARDSDLKAVLLDTQRVFGTGAPEGKEVTLKATAPAETTYMRAWIYSPNIGLTDVTVTKASLSGGVAVAVAAAPEAPAANPAPRSRPALAPAGAAATPAGAPAGPSILANADMKDADGDGVPDGWRVFPDASGDVAKVAMDPAGGAHLVDTDKTKGIGLQQQIPAQAGTPYTFTATLKGTGNLSLNLQFLSGKPARDSDLKGMLLDTKRTFGTGSPEGTGVSLTATAPAGTTYLRAWLYSPNIGVTDVTVTKATLSAGAALAAATLATPKTNDKLLFVGDFESGDYSGWQTQFPKSSKGTIVTEPVRAGKYASRSELTYEDFKNFGKTESMQRRCEIYRENVGQPGQERWYGFSIYLTKGFDDETFDIVMQIHNHPDPGEPGKSPILTLETHGKEWWVNDRWDKNKISQPGEHGAGGTITSNNIYKAPYETEKWTDWAYHVKWALDDTGLIEIYKNGEKVSEYKGPNCYNDEQPFYMKIGVYKPAYRANSLPQRVIYHDEVRIGNEKATLADVSPPKA